MPGLTQTYADLPLSHRAGLASIIDLKYPFIIFLAREIVSSSVCPVKKPGAFVFLGKTRPSKLDRIKPFTASAIVRFCDSVGATPGVSNLRKNGLVLSLFRLRTK